jgi:hypothetical protein
MLVDQRRQQVADVDLFVVGGDADAAADFSAVWEDVDIEKGLLRAIKPQQERRIDAGLGASPV